MCGENTSGRVSDCCETGSPPRVRGKPLSLLVPMINQRITPACAGKTRRQRRAVQGRADHPRVCGENAAHTVDAPQNLGSPPRVRGKPSSTAVSAAASRITPACAGKTPLLRLLYRLRADHPRVCGENDHEYVMGGLSAGSPPRVRGKPPFPIVSMIGIRITPACAGKTLDRMGVMDGK